MLDDLHLPALADLAAAWNDLDDAKARHIEADARIVAALEKAQDSIVTLALQAGDDATIRVRVIQFVYWLEPEVKVAWLAEAFGLRVREVAEIAGKASLPVTCTRCGTEYKVVVTSRAQMQDRLKDEKRAADRGLNLPWTMCSACKEADTAASRERDERQRREYEERLWHLHTMPYREYLQTPEWHERRAQQLRRAHYRCQVCNASRMLNVHHRTYERRGHEEFRDLIVLCADCHTIFHSQGKLAREE